MTAEREQLATYFAARPDKALAFVAEMELQAPEGPVVYACPMHPEVVSREPDKCPKCGMRLLPTSAPAETSFVCPMHPEVTSNSADRCPKCGMKLIPSGLVDSTAEEAHGDHEHERGDHEGHHDHDHPEHEHDHHAGHEHAHGHAAQGIEWEDDMVEVNRMTTPSNTRWKLIDRETGAENAAIDWRFRVGDRVKIRLVNEMDSDHPMPHPFHVHGAGRFLILARDDVEERNLVWKDSRMFVVTPYS